MSTKDFNIHDHPPHLPEIREVFAYVVRGTDGRETLACAVFEKTGLMPMITADENLLPDLEFIAEQMRQRDGADIRLYRFRDRRPVLLLQKGESDADQ